MELFIDRDFLDNFFLLYDNEDIYHEDIKMFFKKLNNCKIITNYNSLEEFVQEAEDSNPMLHYFIEVSVPEIEFREQLTAEVNNEEFYNIGSPLKLLFIESKNNIAKNFGFTSINTTDLSEKWKPFYRGRNEDFNELKTSKDKTLKRHERFEKWEDLQSFRHPIHSIIIVDRYILVDKRNQKISNNLFLLLKNLIMKNTNHSHIDLLIISHELQIGFKAIYNKINTFLKEVLKLKSFHFSLVIDPPGKKFEHFRRIYSNYYTIFLDNSLNIFKDNGSYHDRNTNIAFKFHFNDKNYRFIKKEFKDINDWLDTIENRPKIGSDTEKIYYYPDKKNKLLCLFSDLQNSR